MVDRRPPSPSIDLERLTSFLVLVEELQFTRAAARLYVSQPTLTQRIRSLERALGAELFDRSGSALVLTPAGRRLADVGADLLAHERHVVQAVRQARSDGAETLHVGCTNVGDPTVFVTTAHALLQHGPGVRIDASSGTTPELLRRLSTHVLDLCFVHLPGPDLEPSMQVRPVRQVPLHLLHPIDGAATRARAADVTVAVPADLVLAPSVTTLGAELRVVPGEREVLQYVELGLGPGVITAEAGQQWTGYVEAGEDMGDVTLQVAWRLPAAPLAAQYLEVLHNAVDSAPATDVGETTA